MPSSTTAHDHVPGELRERAEELLRASLGPAAAFRDGQYEAIEALVAGRERLLVVQRTGWGKSSVYFIATRLLREGGAGPTILVSPLLALMRDQVRAAQRLGVHAATINSTNRDEWDEIQDAIAAGEVDILLISPERLASEHFRSRVLEPLLGSAGMLVIDEAHCISDWGHDFRPDYRRIGSLLPTLPAQVPVLATTATANDAVVRDVVDQLGGGGVRQMRGELARASLSLQAIHIRSEAHRMAWLAQNIPQVDGSGIVYVLTKAHARRVAGFLRSEGIDAVAYTAGGAPGSGDDEARLEAEQRLLDNEVKAVVATPALGMGFDKPDLAFVIHFQMPQSLVHYYQQVGRAGRAVDDAIGVLLHGDGDQRITDYFVQQAFPEPAVFESVIAALGRAGGEPVSTTDLARRAKVGRALCEKVLGQLSVEDPPPVRRSGRGWVATGEAFSVDVARMEALTARRHAEYARMQEYARGARCLMAFIAAELDDPAAEPCGRCATCLGREILPSGVDGEVAARAEAWSEAAKSAPRRRRKRRPRAKKPSPMTRRVKRKRRPGGGSSRRGGGSGS